MIRYCRHYLFATRLLLEHGLKPQPTKIQTPREIIGPKSLYFADPADKESPRLRCRKGGALAHQYLGEPILADNPWSYIAAI